VETPRKPRVLRRDKVTQVGAVGPAERDGQRSKELRVARQGGRRNREEPSEKRSRIESAAEKA